MKNLIIYYCFIFIPLFIIIGLVKSNNIDDNNLLILFFSYFLFYRTLTDFYRLRSKNVVGKNDFWKLLIPGFRLKYFKDLYFI